MHICFVSGVHVKPARAENSTSSGSLFMQQTHGFSVPFKFPVLFTQDAWSQSNTVFFDVIRREEPDRRHRVLAIIDDSVASAHLSLPQDIRAYFAAFPDALDLVAPPVIVPGGDTAKNDFAHPLEFIKRINYAAPVL